MTAKQPMPKEVACVNNLTLENYIRSVMSEVPHDDFFRGVENNDEFLTYDEATGKLVTLTKNYLLGPSNWISNKAWRRIAENTITILKDEDAIFKAGKNIFRTAASFRHVLMRFIGGQTIIDEPVLFDGVLQRRGRFFRHPRFTSRVRFGFDQRPPYQM